MLFPEPTVSHHGSCAQKPSDSAELPWQQPLQPTSMVIVTVTRTDQEVSLAAGDSQLPGKTLALVLTVHSKE